MAAIAIKAAEHGAVCGAELSPAGTAVLAGAATIIVVHHYSIADFSFLRGDRTTYHFDDAAWLMAFDHDLRFAALRAVEVVKVAAAHARGLHPNDYFIRPWYRVWVFADLKLAFTQKHNCFHRVFLQSKIVLIRSMRSEGADGTPPVARLFFDNTHHLGFIKRFFAN